MENILDERGVCLLFLFVLYALVQYMNHMKRKQETLFSYF